MQTNNAFINFIQELITRLGQKSPTFFKVLRVIFAIPTVVIAIPEALKLFNVQLPEVFDATFMKIISGFSTAAFIMTFLTVKDADKPAVKEKLPFTKSVSVILVLLLSSVCGFSQSNFFSHIPKIQKPATVTRTIMQSGKKFSVIVPGATASDTTFWAIRPIASAATIFVDGGVKAAAGGGVSYQNITQKYSDGRNYVNYAFSLLALAGGSITTGTSTDIASFGAMVSALNNTVGLGYAVTRVGIDKKVWKGGLMVVWTFNFNN